MTRTPGVSAPACVQYLMLLLGTLGLGWTNASKRRSKDIINEENTSSQPKPSAITRSRAYSTTLGFLSVGEYTLDAFGGLISGQTPVNCLYTLLMPYLCFPVALPHIVETSLAACTSPLGPVKTYVDDNERVNKYKHCIGATCCIEMDQQFNGGRWFAGVRSQKCMVPFSVVVTTRLAHEYMR